MHFKQRRFHVWLNIALLYLWAVVAYSSEPAVEALYAVVAKIGMSHDLFTEGTVPDNSVRIVQLDTSGPNGRAAKIKLALFFETWEEGFVDIAPDHSFVVISGSFGRKVGGVSQRYVVAANKPWEVVKAGASIGVSAICLTWKQGNAYQLGYLVDRSDERVEREPALPLHEKAATDTPLWRFSVYDDTSHAWVEFPTQKMTSALCGQTLRVQDGLVYAAKFLHSDPFPYTPPPDIMPPAKLFNVVWNSDEWLVIQTLKDDASRQNSICLELDKQKNIWSRYEFQGVYSAAEFVDGVLVVEERNNDDEVTSTGNVILRGLSSGEQRTLKLARDRGTARVLMITKSSAYAVGDDCLYEIPIKDGLPITDASQWKTLLIDKCVPSIRALFWGPELPKDFASPSLPMEIVEERKQLEQVR